MKTIKEIRQYFSSSHKQMPKLIPLKKECHDCAVTNGFYLEYAEMLSKLTKEEIEYHSKRWFCHNNPKRACAGNIKYQESI